MLFEKLDSFLYCEFTMFLLNRAPSVTLNRYYFNRKLLVEVKVAIMVIPDQLQAVILSCKIKIDSLSRK